MVIGIPREIKEQEFRVALLPAGAQALVRAGHRVVVEAGAADGAGFPDGDYAAAGAEVLASAAAVYAAADLVVKVKEPMGGELSLFHPGQAVFCYLHSETRPALVEAMLQNRVTGIAYENVRLPDGSLPLLAPMSIVAGQQAILQASAWLCNHRGGPGVSLVAYPGIEPARVVVIGAGNAGVEAARVAAALGAEVALFDVQPARLRALETQLPRPVRLCHSGTVDLEAYLCRADMVVHATMLPPDTPTHLIDRALLRRMKPGCVIVDITANLRGAIETADRYTTHADPVYRVEGIAHFVVPNIPGAVARTASQALAMAVLPYLLTLARLGCREALRQIPELLLGLTCIDGGLTWHEAGTFLNRPWKTPAEALGL